MLINKPLHLNSMALHWCALINNVAQITEDAQGFFKDQNHTQGQLHKQKMSQDTHHPSSLNFEWGKAFFFFSEVSTFVKCTNEPW